ncbi:anti-phage defense-associated sirtuin Dsr1 [Dyella sp. S184]|uniref:anti-phage defense-associated sirtuin Dsr1 n=1 Tax=Dyella sp. S184 TaxID=1641862 RepID=UPI00131AB47A|nr:anti-phage defense-associated sirtuin Dsr1 [Dyella sp. S184]
MQFIKNGPDIPERLLQAHEDGRVVFFCGAGISYPAGLPGFKELVDDIYTHLGATRDPIEKEAFDRGQYDATIDHLERYITGRRAVVRAALAKILGRPKLRRKGATATHRALLQLATDRDSNVRLITTNFDRIFEYVIRCDRLSIPTYAAPSLPIPKISRWNGLVYLHGVLPKGQDEVALNRLILSSGDFGLAYLTERWAARFVSELFRNFTVCFVGYTINDPVLRYMMDAFAADRTLGEASPEAYAFAHCGNVGMEQSRIAWEAKGVTPMLYGMPTNERDHVALHQTIDVWADIYRDGVLGKERIVAQYAVNPPISSTVDDDYVGRVLWAISHETGLPAKRFAELDPVPPLSWLEPLSQDRFNHDDLARFGVPAKARRDDKLAFSLLLRPAPYQRARKMGLVEADQAGQEWDDVMPYLAVWLTRHLNNPDLLLWIAKRGGQLNERFALIIWYRIETLDKLQRGGRVEELARIRTAAPDAVPGPLMRTLWDLVRCGRLKSNALSARGSLYGWLRRLRDDGLTLALRLELRDILTPRIVLRERFRLEGLAERVDDPTRIRDLVDWEVALSADHVHFALRDFRKSAEGDAAWQVVLEAMLFDFNALLREALDLMYTLDGRDELVDLTAVYLPSIAELDQASELHDWMVLVALVRDAWLLSAEKSPPQAGALVNMWWQAPYPLLKRMAFYAAANGSAIEPEVSLSWLLAEDAHWLWAREGRPEMLLLLVAIAPRLNAAQLERLEEAIVHGPPMPPLPTDADPAPRNAAFNANIWLRLAKVQQSGTVLGGAAAAALATLSEHNPDWQLAVEEQGDASPWRATPLQRNQATLPRKRRNLVVWLKQHPATDFWEPDDWRERCGDDFPATATALLALAGENEWPSVRWRDALQAWSEDRLLKPSWRHMVKAVVIAPDELIASRANEIGWWMRAAANIVTDQRAQLFRLARRIFALDDVEEQPPPDSVERAISHPIGNAVEALLRWWYRQGLQDGQGLHSDLEPIFTELCDRTVPKYCSARVLLAAHAISLYRVDSQWTFTHVLPLFDWRVSELEARLAWQGFLMSPRLYPPLLIAMKDMLLATAEHYAKLDSFGRQYADFLTFAAIESPDVFSNGELQQAVRALPESGLRHVSDALARVLGSGGERRKEYWENRVQPFLHGIWPKSLSLVSQSIAQGLALLCIEAGDEFPGALEMLRVWLIALDHPDYVVTRLSQQGLCGKFPKAALTFMDKLISGTNQWLPTELEECLESVRHADAVLSDDKAYKRLAEYVRRFLRTNG